eukprot:scaffold182128_cov30-Attheya_sp.AAC.2
MEFLFLPCHKSSHIPKTKRQSSELSSVLVQQPSAPCRNKSHLPFDFLFSFASNSGIFGNSRDRYNHDIDDVTSISEVTPDRNVRAFFPPDMSSHVQDKYVVSQSLSTIITFPNGRRFIEIEPLYSNERQHSSRTNPASPVPKYHEEHFVPPTHQSMEHFGLGMHQSINCPSNAHEYMHHSSLPYSYYQEPHTTNRSPPHKPSSPEFVGPHQQEGSHPNLTDPQQHMDNTVLGIEEIVFVFEEPSSDYHLLSFSERKNLLNLGTLHCDRLEYIECLHVVRQSSKQVQLTIARQLDLPHYQLQWSKLMELQG